MSHPMNSATFAARISEAAPDATASRTLTQADVGKCINATSASPIVLTIPKDSDGGFSAREFIEAYQGGTGAVSFAAASGVTLRGSAPAGGQYKTVTVIRVGANEWAYMVYS